MADGGVPQGGTLVRSDQDSPTLPSRGTLIERFISLSGTLTRPSSVAAAAEAIGAAALALTEGGRGAVYTHGAGGDTTRVWASHGGFPEHRGPSRPGPVLISDVRDLAEDDEIRRIAEREGYRALASWPLNRAGKTIGSIVCCFEAPRSWSPAELDVMFALALQGAAALEHALRSERPDGPAASVDAEDARIDEALRILQAESAELFEAHRELETQHARLVQARRELGALNVWFLAVQNEFAAERARLAAEQAQLTKAREALDTQITAARQELENESARLADMRRELLDNHDGQAETRREPPVDRTRVSDARRVLEEESVRLMEALELESTPRADVLKVLGPAMVPAEPSAESAPSPANGMAHPAEPGAAYELGGPLPEPQAPEELYSLLVERAAKLLNKERRSLKPEEQVVILGRALDDRDGHRAGYSERLAAWAEATAGMLGCGRDDIADVRRAACLHDLGKIGVPEAILRAVARLTEQERRIVRSVPTLAERVLRPVKGMQGVAAILHHRYEQWDGKGYPDGLKGDQIPLGARILAVVDAYGVMTTVRPYRAMVYSLDAVAELRRCAGVQFDPKVVEAYCNVLKREG